MRKSVRAAAGIVSAVIAINMCGIGIPGAESGAPLQVHAAEVPAEEIPEEEIPAETAEKIQEELSAEEIPEEAAEEIQEELPAEEIPAETAEEIPEELPAEDTSAEDSAEAEASPEEFIESTAEITEDLGSALADDADPEDLFSEYVDRQFYGGYFILFSYNYGDNRFSDDEYNLYLYQSLKDFVTVIAADGGSTTLTIDANNFPEEYLVFEGMDSHVDSIRADVSEAFNNRFHMSDVMTTLGFDCPYELYWFDKVTDGAFSWSYTYSYAKSSDGSVSRAKILSLKISFKVSGEYQADNYSADNPAVTADVSRVAKAVVTAENIVNQYDSLSDRDKLTAYKNAICDLTSYNREAADLLQTKGYGDPWKLVYVFDGDDSTNVVCEGYAKAFQYLCERSWFEGDTRSYIVEGTMQADNSAGENHMWNVVAWNGDNYLVDVTNSDKNQIGQDGELFMVTGIGDALGYSVNMRFYTISYLYNENTLKMYGEDVRSLAKKGGEDPGDQEEIKETPRYTVTWADEDGTVLDTQLVEEGKIPEYSGAAPHKEATAESLYVFDHWSPETEAAVADRTYTAVYEKISRWLEDSGTGSSRKKYLLSPDEYAVSQFYEIAGETYYFDQDGYCATGWKKVDGDWYYFASSGAMKTGWVQTGGLWYYMDASGKMVTGSRTIGGKTYNFSGSGACLNP